MSGIKPFAGWRKTLPLKPEDLDAQITYVSTQGGVVVYRQRPFGIVIEPLGEEKPLVPNPDGIILPPMPKLGLHLTTPKIPWAVYAQIVSFFREVHKVHTAEALIRVFYDPATKTWIPHCPEQDVSTAAVKHKDEFDKEGKFTHVLDIHSHHTMSAFFSSTDDNDEKRAVRLYGVVGLINQPIPASSWRAWTGKKFEDLGFSDVCELPEAIELAVKFPVDAFMKEKLGIKDIMLNDGATKLTERLFNGFPAEWMKQVSATKYYGGNSRFGWMGHGVDLEDDTHPVVGFGGDHAGRSFRGGGVGGGWKTNDKRHHANGRGGNTPAKTGSDGKDANGSTSNVQGPRRVFIDREGPEDEILPELVAAALDTSKCVYLIDRKSDTVYRVYPDGRCLRRDLKTADLAHIKEFKATSETQVFAVPEFTQSLKGEK